MLNRPRDFVGTIFGMMMKKHLENPKELERISSWSMTVLVETDFYPIVLQFDEGVKISLDEVDSPTLSISMRFDTMVSIVKGETSMIGEFLRRNIRIKGLFRHPLSTIRFYKFINSMIGG